VRLRERQRWIQQQEVQPSDQVHQLLHWSIQRHTAVQATLSLYLQANTRMADDFQSIGKVNNFQFYFDSR